MTELEFFAVYSLMLLIGSVFCIGFYIITKAEKTITPDGRVEYNGKIFKFWGQFLQREDSEKWVFYTGDQLEKKFREVCRTNPRLLSVFAISEDRKFLNIIPGQSIGPNEIDIIWATARCKIYVSDTSAGLYDEEIIYKLPEWVRMPLGQCSPCMSSVYGSFVYWGVYFVQRGLFSWTYHPVAAAFGFWVLFCISLSCLNVVFYKKTH